MRLLLLILKNILLVLITVAGTLIVWVALELNGVLNVSVPVVGASMLPTIKEEGVFKFQRFFYKYKQFIPIPQKISRGDIVVFENEKTNAELKKQSKSASGFVKRVIAVEGDEVEIKDGFVNVNNIPISEGYTLKARSTFGGMEIKDCQKIKVKKDTVFVLGDNRKLSMDSRQVGLISLKDISYFVPLKNQSNVFGSSLRNTSADFTTKNESLFNVEEYVRMLNEYRKTNNIEPLTYNNKLEKSAQLRAKIMLQYNEFDSKGVKSGYGMSRAVKDVGYFNILYGEFPMLGYYDAKELYDSFTEQPSAKDFLLNKDYDEIGVSTFVGLLQNCPVQVVVQHLGGYIPPNYKKEYIDSWQNGVDELKRVSNGWMALKDYAEFYEKNKDKVDRMNEIIAIRLSRYESILNTITKNEWLTPQQEQYIKDDDSLRNEQNSLANFLNSQ